MGGIVGSLEEPGVCPTEALPDSEWTLRKLPANSQWGLKARRADVADPRGGVLWEGALNQVDIGRLGGPFPSDEGGKLVTGLGPQMAIPALRFGAQPDEKLGS